MPSKIYNIQFSPLALFPLATQPTKGTQNNTSNVIFITQLGIDSTGLAKHILIKKRREKRKKRKRKNGLNNPWEFRSLFCWPKIQYFLLSSHLVKQEGKGGKVIGNQKGEKNVIGSMPWKSKKKGEEGGNERSGKKGEERGGRFSQSMDLAYPTSTLREFLIDSIEGKGEREMQERCIPAPTYDAVIFFFLSPFTPASPLLFSPMYFFFFFRPLSYLPCRKKQLIDEGKEWDQ